MPSPSETVQLVKRTLAGNEPAYNGDVTFAGQITGTQIDSVQVVNTSAFTLQTSTYGGKTLVLTSASGSRHKRVTLAKTSLVTSGTVFRIINGVGTLTSQGISIIPPAAQKINGSSRGYKSTSLIAKGGAIELVKIDSTYYTRNMQPGSAIASSLVWVII